jgi:hypothetical protein
MEPEFEERLLEKLKALYGRYEPEEITSRLGITDTTFMYLLGKANLPFPHKRIQYVTKVAWRRTEEGGSAPTLRVSRAIVRELNLRDGDRVQWFIEKDRILGIPLKVSTANIF